MAEPKSIQAALNAVMEDVRAVRKSSRNADQGYLFRGIDAVVNAAGPALRTHGVVVMPHLQKVTYRDVQTSKGKATREVTVEVRYVFTGPAGDSLDAIVPGEALDWGDKGTAKAMSVAYRIALLQALSLPTDEPDADASTYERADRAADQAEQAGQAAPAEDEATTWRRRLAGLIQEKGRDPEWGEQQYHEWSQGGDIRAAKPTDLRDFHRYLREQPDVWDAGEPA